MFHADRQKDIHAEIDTHFSQFCESPYNRLIGNGHIHIQATLKMEAVSSVETFVSIHQTTRRRMQEDSTANTLFVAVIKIASV